MAKSSSAPANVALEKIAQLLNNIVDESKLAQHVFFIYGRTCCSIQSCSMECNGNVCIQRMILKISRLL